jgi:hypothetical protein
MVKLARGYSAFGLVGAGAEVEDGGAKGLAGAVEEALFEGGAARVWRLALSTYLVA